MIIANITGNIGQDAEIREANGHKFVSFSVASNTRDREGNQHTDWVRCTYNQEKLAEHLKKGKTVTIVGELKPSIYDGKVQLDMRCMNIEFVGKKEG